MFLLREPGRGAGMNGGLWFFAGWFSCIAAIVWLGRRKRRSQQPALHPHRHWCGPLPGVAERLRMADELERLQQTDLILGFAFRTQSGLWKELKTGERN